MFPKPLSRALVSPEVFACYVQIEHSSIQVGILILSEDFQPGLHCLYDIDSEQPYPVRIDTTTSPQYKVTLRYAALPNPQTH